MKLEPRREGSRRRRRKRCDGGKGSNENTTFLYWFSNSHSFSSFFCVIGRVGLHQSSVGSVSDQMFFFVFVGYGNIRVWHESYACRTCVRVGTASDTATRRISAASMHHRWWCFLRHFCWRENATRGRKRKGVVAERRKKLPLIGVKKVLLL